MQKRGSERREHPRALPRPSHGGSKTKKIENHIQLRFGQGKLPDQDQRIDRDQGDGHDREGAVTVGFRIIDWDHGSLWDQRKKQSAEPVVSIRNQQKVRNDDQDPAGSGGGETRCRAAARTRVIEE